MTLLLASWLDVGPTDFTPVEWNDQIGYWHYISSFSEVGFGSGYYVPNERPAPIGFIHFDAHGPAVPVIYGSLAAVTGWRFSTSVMLNMLLVGVSILAFVWGARLDKARIFCTLLVVLFTWQVLFYIPTAMQESLQHAIAFTLALLFSCVIRRGESLSPPTRILFVLILLCAAVARLSWALLFVPLMVMTRRRKDRIGLAYSMVIAGLLIVTSMLVLKGITPAEGSSIFGSLRMVAGAPLDGVRQILDVTIANIAELAALVAVDDLGSAVLKQTLALAGMTLAWLVLRRFRRDRRPSEAGGSSAEIVFHVYNLAIIVTTSLLFYIPNGYERVFFPPLLVSLLLLLTFRRFLLVALVLVLSLFHLPYFRATYDGLAPLFTADRAAIEARRDEMSRILRYDPNVTDPWCNTVLIPVEIYDDRVLTIPAGVGVSYVIAPGVVGDDRRLATPFVNPTVRSRYLLDTEQFSLAARLPAFPGQFLGMTPSGRLYFNPQSGCDPPRWPPGDNGVLREGSDRPARTRSASRSDPG